MGKIFVFVVRYKFDEETLRCCSFAIFKNKISNDMNFYSLMLQKLNLKKRYVLTRFVSLGKVLKLSLIPMSSLWQSHFRIFANMVCKRTTLNYSNKPKITPRNKDTPENSCFIILRLYIHFETR